MELRYLSYLFILSITSTLSITQERIGCITKVPVTTDTEEEVHYVPHNLTLERCAELCKNTTFMAVSDGYACRCMNTIQHYPNVDTSWDCFNSKAIRCDGNNLTYCGSAEAKTFYLVCPVAKYGKDCDQNCACESQICNPEGECLMCGLGMRELDGNRCGACSTGKFGVECALTCPTNCARNCEPINGKCRTPCAGDHGDYCLDSCPPGLYGAKCESRCSVNCISDTCDASSGHCKAGCKGGTFWGDICMETCDSCLDSKCDQSGACTEGCRNGKYGGSCSLSCPEHCVFCDQTTGTCENGGCQPHRWGNICQNICADNCTFSKGCDMDTGICHSCELGWYGPQCVQSCPNTCDGGVCKQDDGSCYGCEEGWKSKSCDERCPAICKTCLQEAGECVTCKNGKCGAECDKQCPNEATTPKPTIASTASKSVLGYMNIGIYLTLQILLVRMSCWS